MRIVLDARPLSHPQAGGFRAYVRALLRGLIERGTGDLELLLYVDRPLDTAARSFVPPGAVVRVLAPDRLKTDLRLFPAAVRRDRPDLVHGTVNYLPAGLAAGAARTVTIHDAMGIKRYDWDVGVPRTPRERFINRYWAYRTRASARAARRIVTVSQGAAAEIAATLRLPAERFTVVPSAVSLPPPCPERTPAEPADDCVLAIASPDPRKNVDLLLHALETEAGRFPGGRAPRLDLVCTNAAAAARAEAALVRRGIRDYRLLTDVDDQALSNRFAMGPVFAWPSRLEGFGLPPVEAMWAGCTVAASRAPVMPEVLGDDAPLYFDPDSAAGCAEALARLLAEPPEARRLRILAGKAHAAQYTCRRMADETVAAWRSALEGASR